MTLQRKRFNGYCRLLCFAAVLISCAPYPIYKHAAAGKTAHFTKKKKNAVPVARQPDCSLARQAADTARQQGAEDITAPDEDSLETQAEIDGVSRSSFFSVPCRTIRVALRQNARRATFCSAGQVDFLSSGAQPFTARGTFTCSRSSDEKLTCVVAGRETVEYALPCTLRSSNAFNIIDFDGVGYRGSMILSGEGRGVFTVINFCDVEDYLRGVVPLEIGGGPAKEAIKAQAIAARTYTYKKIIERQKQSFDVFPSIADQVYGGVSAEKPPCNQAIRDCRDLVAVYKDSLIYAYYHSTCGGKTANVEDVWDKPNLPYLRSINDCDENGAAFCRASPNYTWEESWQISQLSDIISRFSHETFPQNPTSGRLTGLSVESRFPCGRVQTCAVVTTSGRYRYGGDRIRFVLRRAQGNSILRSALITGIKQSGNSLRLSGRGYGHGVGLCQFGAMGRANAGQNCEQIIKAYYTGVEIRGIACGQQ